MQTDAFRLGIGEAKWNCKVQVLHPELHFKCDLGRCDSGSGGPGTTDVKRWRQQIGVDMFDMG